MMWLRKKLKRGQASLLTLKNRLTDKLIVCLVFFSVLTGMFYYSEKTMVSAGVFFTPTDTFLSLGQFYEDLSKKEDVTYILYHIDGGSNSSYNPKFISRNEKYVSLRIPHKFGYDFLGWYIDPEFRYKVDKVDYVEGKSVTLFAKWSRRINNEYNVKNYEYTSRGKKLKDCTYDFLEDISIPGMPDTKEDDMLNNIIYSQSQCPQGLCITDDFVLMTSYSTEADCLGELIVFSRETGDYLITLGMDPESHLGGIAFDGVNVWVCNSKNKTIERISYDFIQLMAFENTNQVVDATEVVDVYKVKNTPSCITYYDGRLWIATHNILFNSTMKAYCYDNLKDELNVLSEYSIPPQVQGIAFDDKGQVYLSTSYGRNMSSYIKQYSSVVELSSNPNQPEKKVELPPGSEEVDIAKNSLFVIFESAGEKYLEGTDGKGYCYYPIDKILRIDISSL